MDFPPLPRRRVSADTPVLHDQSCELEDDLNSNSPTMNYLSLLMSGAWADSSVLGKESCGMEEDLEVDRKPIFSRLISGSCKSSEGISVAVVDANALIEGGEKLHGYAEKFVTTEMVMKEIRDRVSRDRINMYPFKLEIMEPYDEAVKKVFNFAKETGDLHTLSDVDVKLIALTYMLETQIHGTKNLRERPPPLQMVKVKRFSENEMPGWGSNVPNLEEWEALEDAVQEDINGDSRILPLKNIELNVLQEASDVCSEGDSVKSTSKDDLNRFEADEHHSRNGRRRFQRVKREVNIEGKKMVAAGIDASKGETVDNTEDWKPVVSRSTHMRYLKRQARRSLRTASEISSSDPLDMTVNMTDGETNARTTGNISDEVPECDKQEIECNEAQKDQLIIPNLTDQVGLLNLDVDDAHPGTREIDGTEASSVAERSFDESSEIDDSSSEQSWGIMLSESSVACVTKDFAMQNVLLQMGLRLLSPNGVQIRQLHRWVLKCQACNRLTGEIGRIFCPKCGNGGTLRKVAVTVDGNGIIQAARRPRINVRGTRFSLPKPHGGREAVAKNPILREDQLPRRMLHPRTKKKQGDEETGGFDSGHILFQHSEERGTFKPPVRRAMALFAGKRNPNDNHFSVNKH